MSAGSPRRRAGLCKHTTTLPAACLHRISAASNTRGGSAITGKLHAEPRSVDASACYFYHTTEVPGHGVFRGEWDLRGRESIYLGSVDFANKSVLEIGTASGHLCFWMEEQGAAVTGLDLDARLAWDLVAHDGANHEAQARERYNTLDRINNSWWFAHAKRASSAQCIYRSIYELSADVGTFDVVTVCSVLLHLRDPIRAIELASARSRSEIVITDVSERQFAGAKAHLWSEKCLHFIPRAEQKGAIDAWYYLPSALVAEAVKIFGFPNVSVTQHTQRFMDGHDWQFYTVVGRR